MLRFKQINVLKKVMSWLPSIAQLITEAGLDDTTMVIVTNTADYEDVSLVATGSVAEGDDFIAVK